MKTIIKSGIVLASVLALGGCVYGPDYGYVRGDGYYGDAYYGDAYYGGPAYYGSGYYSPGYYGYGPYGYGYGPSIGIYYSDYGHRHHGWHGNGSWSDNRRPTIVPPYGARGTPPTIGRDSRGPAPAISRGNRSAPMSVPHGIRSTPMSVPHGSRSVSPGTRQR